MKPNGFLLLSILGISLSLSAQVRLEGRVSGSNGAPIAGATVAVVPVGSYPPLASIPAIQTNGAGQFTLVSKPGRATLTVTAAAHLPQSRALDLIADQAVSPLEIRLELGGRRIRGNVADDQGGIPPGAHLAFLMISDGKYFLTGLRNGAFEVNLADGPCYVMAEAEGCLTSTSSLNVVRDIEMKPLILHSNPVPAGPEVRRWIKEQAVPLNGVEAPSASTGLSALKKAFSRASVVALGEATHGTSDFFRLKHRIVKYLVEEAGFSVFALEASLPDAFAVNDYVLNGRGDPAAALAGLGYWTCDFEEVLEMIEWMRDYNADPAHRLKVKFYGFDMNSPFPAFTQVKEWLLERDPEGAKLLEFRRGDLVSPAEAGRLKDAAELLIARLDKRNAGPIGGDGGEQLERQKQNLRLLVQWADKMNDPFGVEARDEAMAANVRWIQSQEPGAKLVVWAHNSHIGYGQGSMGSFNPMGWHLRQALGEKYVAAALAFREGGFLSVDASPERKGLCPLAVAPHPGDTLGEALASAGREMLALDLGLLPKQGPERAWFNRPQGLWHIGSSFSLPDQDRAIDHVAIAADYDLIFFIARSTAGHPNPRRPQKALRGSLFSPPPPDLKLPDYVNPAPANLDFEESGEGASPTGWRAGRGTIYTAQCLPENPKEGHRCLKISFKGTVKSEGARFVMQFIDAKPYRGKKIRWSGWIRTDGQAGSRGRLLFRADIDPENFLLGFYDDMNDRPITTADWTKAVIEGLVDSDALYLTVGLGIEGTGTVWFDGMTLEIIE